MKNFNDFRKSQLTEEEGKKKKDPKPFRANNLATLRNIVARHKEDTVEFSGGAELEVDVPEANALISIYSRLSKENKIKFEELLTKGVHTFMRLTKFAMSNSNSQGQD